MIEQVKGTRNLYGLEAEKYLYIYDIFRKSFNTYGYDLIELPTIEYKEFCLLYTSPSPRDGLLSRMPSSA